MLLSGKYQQNHQEVKVFSADIKSLENHAPITSDMTDSFMLLVPKNSQTIFRNISLKQEYFWKKFEGEMLNRTQLTNLLQIFSGCRYHSWVIFKSIGKQYDLLQEQQSGTNRLTLPMLRLLSYKAKRCKDFRNPSKPCHIDIHWTALTEHSQMSTHVPAFQYFSGFLHHFVLAKLATRSIKVNIRHRNHD